ncbi:lipoate--protein ligase family protein [Bifidobacterium sp. 82T24]|uniref:lipoate--protein ligase family protein n=1 Tax=Bifidobacterium pluvialisilvae TaxID=2834436 RepID=UPI001C56175F|nr:biotin/lipoate A/B protein ligase family protein [Bifidobacterium pluvialisilvae]MBW3087616.1 lipoate--protein ligase family protein [Bifidobacterium pluvialisilvae]
MVKRNVESRTAATVGTVGRGECKTIGGKLVAVSVRLCGSTITEAHIDGDFLIDENGSVAGEADRSLIADIERAIVSAGVTVDAISDTGADGKIIASVEGNDHAASVDDCRTSPDAVALLATIEAVIAGHPHTRLVGTTADAIVTATMRAIHNIVPAGNNTVSGPINIAPAGGVCRQRRRGMASGAKSVDVAVPDTGASVAPEPTDTKPADVKPAENLTERWSSLAPRVDVVIDAEPYAPPMQMALDEVIARRVAAGIQPPTLRFWRWGSPAVVIGAYQSVRNEVDGRAADLAGFTVVRRVTGGGAMFVRPDDTITYSLYVPESFTAGLDAAASYRLCDTWAFGALHAIGIPAVSQSLNDIATTDGGKIGGAAQRRFPAPRGSYGNHGPQNSHDFGDPHGHGPGCVLHHVTMAYDIDAGLMTRVLRISREKLVDKAVSSAKKRVTPLRTLTSLGRDVVVESMRAYALAHIPGAQPAHLPADVIDEAESLAGKKFENPDWTYRIP